MVAAHDIERFVAAQAPLYARALVELRTGRKRSHWMWFIFPQLAGLGRSPTAVRFAVRNREEAEDYLEHPLLGARLRECTEAMLGLESRSLTEILGFPDDLKFRSCMTLFASLSPPDSLFHRALDRFCDGLPDPRTLELLGELEE